MNAALTKISLQMAENYSFVTTWLKLMVTLKFKATLAGCVVMNSCFYVGLCFHSIYEISFNA